MTTGTDLAGIVARDAQFLELAPLEDGGSLAAQLILDGYRDRRALLVLLRETREALATLYHNVTDGNGVRYHAAVPVLHASRKKLDALAALAEPTP